MNQENQMAAGGEETIVILDAENVKPHYPAYCCMGPVSFLLPTW